MTTQPDPRPQLRNRGAPSAPTVDGQTCSSCGLHTLTTVERCPHCNGILQNASFGPNGVIWSSTVVRVPVPGRTPPYLVAYVDLVDGPRVLCHLAGETERIAVGTLVQLCDTSAEGDLRAEVST